MSNGGRRLKELIVKRGFRLSAVAKAIDVQPHTITNWTDNAPISKLANISEFTGIPLMDVINSIMIDRDSQTTDSIEEN
jgi:hypothetical protein